MALKSTPEKRNTYKDDDGNLMKGYTLSELGQAVVTFLEKRPYQWGKFAGVALKVRTQSDVLCVIEITANTPRTILQSKQVPDFPFLARFAERTSTNGHGYHTIELIDENGEVIPLEENDGPLPF